MRESQASFHRPTLGVPAYHLIISAKQDFAKKVEHIAGSVGTMMRRDPQCPYRGSMMADPGIRLVLHHLCQVAARQATEGVPNQQLLQRYVTERDEEAFAALVHRHGPMVLGVCRRQLRQTHDAEDAFQATFLVLARKAASIRKGESVTQLTARGRDTRGTNSPDRGPAPGTARTSTTHAGIC